MLNHGGYLNNYRHILSTLIDPYQSAHLNICVFLSGSITFLLKLQHSTNKIKKKKEKNYILFASIDSKKSSTSICTLLES